MNAKINLYKLFNLNNFRFWKFDWNHFASQAVNTCTSEQEVRSSNPGPSQL